MDERLDLKVRCHGFAAGFSRSQGVTGNRPSSIESSAFLNWELSGPRLLSIVSKISTATVSGVFSDDLAHRNNLVVGTEPPRPFSGRRPDQVALGARHRILPSWARAQQVARDQRRPDDGEDLTAPSGVQQQRHASQYRPFPPEMGPTRCPAIRFLLHPLQEKVVAARGAGLPRIGLEDISSLRSERKGLLSSSLSLDLGDGRNPTLPAADTTAARKFAYAAATAWTDFHRKELEKVDVVVRRILKALEAR